MFKPDSDNHARLNRRQALLFPAAAGLGVASATTAQPAETKPVPAGGTVATPRSAVAKTQYGKVRGYVDDGVLTFKGVPYGASTGGGTGGFQPSLPRCGTVSTRL